MWLFIKADFFTINTFLLNIYISVKAGTSSLLEDWKCIINASNFKAREMKYTYSML